MLGRAILRAVVPRAVVLRAVVLRAVVLERQLRTTASLERQLRTTAERQLCSNDRVRTTACISSKLNDSLDTKHFS